jgi:ABC-type multidrug transport system fused ATPase/permease subunit
MRDVLKIIQMLDRRERVQFWLGFFYAIITSLITVGIGIGFGTMAARFVDLINKKVPSSAVLWVLFWLGLAYLVNAAVSYLQEKSSDTFRLDSLRKLRLEGYDHLQKLPTSFFERNRAGSLVQRANNSMVSVIGWLADFVDYRIYNITIPVFSVIALLKYHWVIGLMATIGLGIVAYINIRKIRLREPYVRAANIAWEDVFGQYTETISHITTVKTSTIPSKIRTEFLKGLDTQKTHRRNQNKIEWRYNALQYTLEGAIICGVMFATTAYAIKGIIGVAALVAILRLIQNAASNSRNIGGLYQSYCDAVVEAERFTSLLAEPADHLDIKSQKNLRQIVSIEFIDVSFTYPFTHKEVLRGLSFKFEEHKAKKIAFVGESGGGKSTVSKLLLRLYEPTSGTILINGEPIESYTPQSIRNSIGSVMQDVALFHTTVSENILMAHPSAKIKDVKKALRIAHADFVSTLEDGVKTIIGERGVKLSGGQRQRIAIARAAIKQPSFILLDEATSALDSVSEREVQIGLDELIKGKNSLVIAHRLSTIKDADEIIVIEKGSIVERGTHSKLIDNNSYYAKLWAHQSDGFVA